MPRVSGVFSLPAGYQAVTGEIIQPSQHNPPLEDIAQALTDSLPRDGSAGMTGNLAMGSNRITGLGAATSAGHAPRLDQVVDKTGDRMTGELLINTTGSKMLSLMNPDAPSGTRRWHEYVNTSGNLVISPSANDGTLGGGFFALLNDANGLSNAIILGGTGWTDVAPSPSSIMTRGRGDTRYLQLIGGDISGSITASGGITAGTFTAKSGSNEFTLSNGIANAYVDNNGAGSIQFRFNGTTSASFDPNGSLSLFGGASEINWDSGLLQFIYNGTVAARLDPDGALGGVHSLVKRGEGDGRYAMQTTSVSSGNGLTGGGGLSTSRTISMGTPSDITRTSTNSASGTTHTHRITQANFQDMFTVFCASGSVGSFVFARNTSGTDRNYGQTISGGSLVRVGLDTSGDGFTGSTMSGTWECLGNGNSNLTTLWRRVA